MPYFDRHLNEWRDETGRKVCQDHVQQEPCPFCKRSR